MVTPDCLDDFQLMNMINMFDDFFNRDSVQSVADDHVATLMRGEFVKHTYSL